MSVSSTLLSVSQDHPQYASTARCLRLLLAASPITAENPASIDADALAFCEGGRAGLTGRHGYHRPGHIILEIPQDKLNRVNPGEPCSDGTSELDRTLSYLGLTDKDYGVAYLSKDGDKAGVRLLVEEGAYRNLAGRAASVLSNARHAAQVLDYEPSRCAQMLAFHNSLPFQAIMNCVRQSHAQAAECRGWMENAAQSGSYELAAAIRDHAGLPQAGRMRNR